MAELAALRLSASGGRRSERNEAQRSKFTHRTKVRGNFGNRKRAEENAPGEHFCRRGNERSEAIDAGASGQNPFERAKTKNQSLMVGSFLFFDKGRNAPYGSRFPRREYPPFRERRILRTRYG